mgnify:CR=1 FL=1
MASIKDIERITKALNKDMGFKGIKYTRPKSGKNKGKLKVTGSGFVLNQAYGRIGLDFQRAPSTGVSTVLGFSSKKSLYEQIVAMRLGVRWYKQRTKKR